MSETAMSTGTESAYRQSDESDLSLTNCCRICKRNAANGAKLRPLFSGERLIRIIVNTIHMEIKDVPGLPRYVCEKCLDVLKKFSTFQLAFRRSEEKLYMALERRKNAPMESLITFAHEIETDRQKEKELKKATTKNSKKEKKTTSPKLNLDKKF
ncbi:uncharacterized protein LOC115629845 [Scaptodrosophila lebanonensis]|uniref:Uncharacterized protein LOC115629845 n=1 Tax=Drosophila lebanonensis TaxID=7225 RepID=A0A6J2U329_DROLE|nr:uncharacterized protein LOC115629845 [Scaptodrosophila lebanonensis]